MVTTINTPIESSESVAQQSLIGYTIKVGVKYAKKFRKSIHIVDTLEDATIFGTKKQISEIQHKIKDDKIEIIPRFAEVQTPKKHGIDDVNPRGRPPACEERLIGFKLKVGSRYAKVDENSPIGISLVKRMGEGSSFPHQREVDVISKTLIDGGHVHKWGDSYRLQTLPRYS